MMAAAHHKSLVSSVPVHSLTRIKYRWSVTNYRAVEISEQAAKKTKNVDAAKHWIEGKGIIMEAYV